MNDTQKGIVTLLKSAITERPLPLPEGFSLDEALPTIQKHHVTPLAYDGAVRCGLPAQSPAMQTLFQSYCKALLLSERQMQALDRVFAAFDAAKIDYLPLKGCRMKARYPKPELRVMGDADVLIRMEQYGRIAPLMDSLGFQPRADTDHELSWQNGQLYLELHKRLIPSYNKDLYAYYGDGWRLAVRECGTRCTMTPEDEWIYLFTHFAKHFRDGGVGCRHVADLWVYRRTAPPLDEAYLTAELTRLGLLTFYRNTMHLLAVWFEDAPADAAVEPITAYIFDSGSWGREESRALSRTVRDAGPSPRHRSGRLVYLRQILFPGVEMLQGKYTVLQKAPWALPLVWLVRPFYKLLFERDSLKRQRTNLRAVSAQRMKDRQSFLHAVGLDYNF